MFKMKENNNNMHWGACRIKSELVYAICKILHLNGDFKINILHKMRENTIRQRGHAWVTCNDKDLLLTPAYRQHSMSKIGENSKYCYWIYVTQGRLKHHKNMNPHKKNKK